MDSPSKERASRRPSRPSRPFWSRRIVVVLVPPVDELDLVGPLQVFNSVNRLAARAIYAVEIVTSADRLVVDGEGGALSFNAKSHSTRSKEAVTPYFWCVAWDLAQCVIPRYLLG